MKKLIATGLPALGALLLLVLPAFGQWGRHWRGYRYPSHRYYSHYARPYYYPRYGYYHGGYPYYYPTYRYYYPTYVYPSYPTYVYPSYPTYVYPSYPTYNYSYSLPTYSYTPTNPAPYTTPSSATVTIGAYDNYFQPGNFQIAEGTQVRWVNNGQHIHTVTADDGSWDSGDLTPGAAFVKTFDRPGTYYYYCRHHTEGAGMRGTIVVGSASSYSSSSGY